MKNKRCFAGCLDAKAFTLIELLVVVLIIGILAAVAVPQYKVAVAKSRLSAIRPILASVKQAEEAYYMANGEYTGVVTDWDVLGVDLSSCIVSSEYRDVFYCGEFAVDPMEGNNGVVSGAAIRAIYCPGKIGVWATCRDQGEYEFRVWLDHSSKPGGVSCGGRTDLGRKVCRSLKL